MSDIPKNAIDALARELASFAGEDAPNPEVYRDPAEAMLRVVEEAWPHKQPERDVRSTLSSSAERAWAPTTRARVSAKAEKPPFGFGVTKL